MLVRGVGSGSKVTAYRLALRLPGRAAQPRVPQQNIPARLRRAYAPVSSKRGLGGPPRAMSGLLSEQAEKRPEFFWDVFILHRLRTSHPPDKRDALSAFQLRWRSSSKVSAVRQHVVSPPSDIRCPGQSQLFVSALEQHRCIGAHTILIPWLRRLPLVDGLKYSGPSRIRRPYLELESSINDSGRATERLRAPGQFSRGLELHEGPGGGRDADYVPRYGDPFGQRRSEREKLGASSE